MDSVHIKTKKKKPAKQETFTRKQLEAYQNRVHRSHMEDLARARETYYADGVANGRYAVIEALINLLELDSRFVRKD